MIVAVDGRTPLVVSVAPPSWSDFAADLALADGPHALTVRFDNDARTANVRPQPLVDRVR